MSTYSPPERSAALTGKRILVVEDEGLVAMLVQDGLADAGAEVIGPAGSVADALQLVETAMGEGGISGAVLDLNLGGEPVFPVADALIDLGVPFLFETENAGIEGLKADAAIMHATERHGARKRVGEQPVTAATDCGRSWRERPS